ncbi:MAG: ParB family protein [Hyphomicrobiales bacterium]|nr:ParB family protein [Hyphomicrobiales bacterium]
MGRKNLLTDLDGDKLTAVNDGQRVFLSGERAPSQPTLGSRGAVGAMSRSLELISAERDAAKALSVQVAAGQIVIDVEPSLIDASIVPDRMPGNDEDHVALVASIAASGQLVPVLLRPHPTIQGRFQTAYGHRRVRALAELRRPVRAVIRELSDEELVVAQGKENSERRDLSFIERASYAIALDDRGFGRETIMSALSVDKTELSRLISVGRALPRSLVEAIGPAPKAGRRRWSDLVERVAGRQAEKAIAETLALSRFAAASSDDRFSLVWTALSASKPTAANTTTWAGGDGKKIARIERHAHRITLSLDEKAAPRFGDFLIGQLPDLYAAFLSGRKSG